MDSIELKKLFCGGLDENTTNESLGAYFSQFGTVVDSSVVKNPETHVSRKFGFLTFADRHEADAAVEGGEHTVDGKVIDVKLAVRKDIVDAIKNGAKKVFVGGLPKDCTEDEIIEFFNNHMLRIHVKNFILKKNKETDVSRGFGFLTPENDHHLAKIAHVQHFVIKGKKAECNIAHEAGSRGAPMSGGPGAGGRGAPRGRGGGMRGGRGGGGGYQSASTYGSGYDSYGNGYTQDYNAGYDAYSYDGSYGAQAASYDSYGSTAGYGGGYGGGTGGYGGSTYTSGGGGAGGTRGRGRSSYHPYSR